MFSIIVCSHRPERAAAITAHYDKLFVAHPHEIIVISDARSLCEGYTRGFHRSRGELVIFSHDDIEFVTLDVPARIEAHLNEYDVVGIAGTRKLIDAQWFEAGDPFCFALVIYPEANGLYSIRCAGAGPMCVADVQALDGCFIACRRCVVENVGFDAETFDGFHLYDVDFTFRSYLKGFRIAVCRDLALIHQSQGKPDEIWRTFRDRFIAKFKDQLERGEPGEMRVFGTEAPKHALQSLCEPANLRRGTGWN